MDSSPQVFCLSRKLALAVLLPILAAVLVFSPSLKAGFVWDDAKYYSSGGQGAEAGDAWPKWFFRPAFYALVTAELRLNEIIVDPGTLPLDENRAALPHAAALAMHALVSGAVALFAARLLEGRQGRELGALAAGLLFAVHPVHAENASWCSAAADNLAALFLFGALFLGIRARDDGRPGLYAVAMLFLIGAMLSKEPAVAGAFLIPLALWAVPARTTPGTGGKPLPLIACAAGAFAAAGGYWALRYAFHRETGSLLPPDLAVAAKQSLSAFAFYVGKLFYPWPQTPFVPVLPGKTETLAWTSVALAALLWSLWTRRTGEKLPLFAFAWFGLSCLPLFGVAVKSVSHSLAAERYLYLPSVGFCLAFGLLTARLALNSGKRAVSLIVVASAVSVPVSMYASAGWKDELSLWTRVSESRIAVNHPMPWMNLGRAYFMDGRLDDAEQSFLKSLGSRDVPDDPSKSYSHGYLALIMKKRALDEYGAGNLPVAYELIAKAERHFEEALKLLPRDAETKTALEVTRYQKKMFEEALKNPGPAR